MTTLTLDDARRIAVAAERRAGELACAITVTVVDGGGHIRAQSRMDGARFGTLGVSTSKAHTAVAFGAPTKILAGLTQPGQSLYGFADAVSTPFAAFAGGVPIVVDDQVVGAIGISGGSVDQDQEIAEAGVGAIVPVAV